MLEPQPLDEAVVGSRRAGCVDHNLEGASPRTTSDLDRQQEKGSSSGPSGAGGVHQSTECQIEIGVAGLLEHRVRGALQVLESSRVDVVLDDRIDSLSVA